MKELNQDESKPLWLTSASIFVFEGVKDHLKGVIGTAVVGIFAAIALYIWSGQAYWLVPLALYLVSFIVGVVLTLAVLGFIGFRSVLQTREQAAVFAAGLASRDKGFFDYFVDLEELQPQFTKTISEIGNEMGNIGCIAGTIDLPGLTPRGSRAVVDGLARAARQIVQHTENMASEQTELELLLPRMIDATSHQVQSTFTDPSSLPAIRISLVELRTHSQAARDSMTNWRTAQQNIYGMSQEMNTAVNHMIAVTDRIVTTLQASEDRWSEQLETIDKRLLGA